MFMKTLQYNLHYVKDLWYTYAYMNTKYFSLRISALALIFSLMYGMGAPVTALAASHSKTSVAQASGTFDASDLLIESGERHIRLSGMASSTTKVRYEITATSSSKRLAKSRTIKVRSEGDWSGSVSKKLKDGQYDVTLYAISGSHKKEIASSTLTVGIPEAVLSVSPIALLGGGTAHAGATVPISYLQVRNVSSSTVAVKGFWVTQAGTAPDSSVVAFSSVDDRGNNRTAVTTSLKKGKAYIPSTAVLAPGERRLFTLKAQLAPNASMYSGTTLMLNVASIDAASSFKGSFPIRGTTWVVSR
jgi:hypothetical protein